MRECDQHPKYTRPVRLNQGRAVANPQCKVIDISLPRVHRYDTAIAQDCRIHEQSIEESLDTAFVHGGRSLQAKYSSMLTVRHAEIQPGYLFAAYGVSSGLLSIKSPERWPAN